MQYSPILQCSVVDTNPDTLKLTKNGLVLIRHHSNAKAAMYAKAQGGASINLDTCIIRNGSEITYGTEHTFENVASNTFAFAVEDSEGRYASQRIVATMIDYIKLTCNVATVRPDATGKATLSCYGNYYNGDFGEFGNIDNYLIVGFQCKNSDGKVIDSGDMYVTINGNSYTATREVKGLDYQSYYELEINAYDALTNLFVSSGKVSCKPVFHWGQNDVTFEAPVNFNSGDIRAKGNLWLKGDDNYGNYLYFGDKELCYIAEKSDNVLTIKAPTLDLSANSVTLNNQSVAFPVCGVWTPSFYPGVAEHTYNNFGWYSKTGNIVTVGFYLKVACSEGYETTPVSIYGLPYVPAIASAGGGMCSGALIHSNKNFQCFVAETTGLITTRAQACDGTAGNSLETSASACFYPTMEILTASGTISYFTNN